MQPDKSSPALCEAPSHPSFPGYHPASSEVADDGAGVVDISLLSASWPGLTCHQCPPTQALGVVTYDSHVGPLQ
jgi:hypothetical protein